MSTVIHEAPTPLDPHSTARKLLEKIDGELEWRSLNLEGAEKIERLTQAYKNLADTWRMA